MNPITNPGSSLNRIDTAYHEATHAVLTHLRKEELKNFIAEWQKHYKDAPMKDGSTSKDTERLFHEAAGGYVGYRASAWWRAWETLVIVTIQIATGKNANMGFQRQSAQNARKNYNREMQDRGFGYEEVRFTQVHTRHPISVAIKQRLDADLLEGKIPDDFGAVPKFNQLYMEIMLDR
jgi:hypothetical protein